jgi:hypothetical protein
VHDNSLSRRSRRFLTWLSLLRRCLRLANSKSSSMELFRVKHSSFGTYYKK